MDNREPCPWRIVEDCGAAFAMGAIGGSIFHGIKGLRNAPSGYSRRLNSGLTLVRQKATVTGANFAAWGGMFSVCDCTLAYIRQKEDPWNSIASGFITGGLLQIRQGPAAMFGAAVVGGLILGMIEGVSMAMSRISGQMVLNEQMSAHQQQ
ncbi:mitochondrial import inner membrane translocase subunit Tim17-B-like [Brachionus plicatilis]|uniref:Mitochondrial import inner membrane translocase subunit Tim17-B-like n=1 Tax=Brachionus plicatilis TaxID=10195 RepID=A0A3M7QBL9_BRAPC|nr:mitochondrial import inner membrane translocase subunit Tim17-B-like [Brachionus plicatilis]